MDVVEYDLISPEVGMFWSKPEAVVKSFSEAARDHYKFVTCDSSGFTRRHSPLLTGMICFITSINHVSDLYYDCLVRCPEVLLNYTYPSLGLHHQDQPEFTVIMRQALWSIENIIQ